VAKFIPKIIIGVVIFVVALVLILNGIVIVQAGNIKVLTQFGRTVGVVFYPGIHMKIPFIQKVNTFEKRILEWDGDPKQIPTSDKRYIWLDTFSRWQIIDPLKFFQTTRNETSAHSRLDDIISGSTRDVVSSNSLIELVRNTDREMTFTEGYQSNSAEDIIGGEINIGRRNIAKNIFTVSDSLVAEYGIKLIDVKIKRINYVEEVRQKVYERMISERNKIAAKYRSEGQGTSAEILGKTQRELDQIQSEAYETSQEIIGKADADAIKIYARAYNRDPEFYEFLKTLETYEKTVDEKNTMIMSTDSDYYKYFKKIGK
jgi:membrane protease subunit HflC